MNGTVSDGEELRFTILQRVPLAIYCCIMAFFGIFGNGTVIYSSLRYNAIRLDKISLIFVQNLAIADILYTICVILPQMVTYLAGGWVLGPVYCFLAAQISFIPGSANALTVLALTGYRLRLISSPFSSVSRCAARGVMAGVWLAASSGTIISLGYGSSSTFNPANGKCMSSIYINKAAKVPFLLAVALIVILPIFLTTIFNTVLVFFSIRSSRRMRNMTRRKGEKKKKESNYKALLMVCSLSGLFIVSWVPYITFTFLKMKSPDISPSLDLLAFHCIFINSFGNPILYSLTNKRFGEYVKGVLRGLFCCCDVTPPAEPGLSSSTARATTETET